MKGYESIFITDAELSPEAMSGLVEKIKASVTRYGGTLHHYMVWGHRRLAYPIGKKNYGVYHVLYMSGNVEMLDELQRQYRFLEGILRNQTIQLDDVEAEMAQFQALLQKGAPSTKPEEAPVSPDAVAA